MKTSIALGLTALTVASATPLVKRQSEDNSTSSMPVVDDTTILNYALTLEHLENAFYAEALDKFDAAAFTDAGLPAWARGRFEQVAAHEAAHVQFLSAALGDNATQPCTYNFNYTTPVEFAALSQILEGVGVSAYAGAAQYITNPEYLTAAAVVLSTEARHASWVAGAVNHLQPWSGPLDVPLSLNQVYSLASAFITSCPEGNPMLPVKAFPTLTFSPITAQPNEEIMLTYEGMADNQTAVFLTGLSSETAMIMNGSVMIPGDLQGTVYLVITNGSANVTDDTTIAGPAIFEFDFDSDGNSTSKAGF